MFGHLRGWALDSKGFERACSTIVYIHLRHILESCMVQRREKDLASSINISLFSVRVLNVVKKGREQWDKEAIVECLNS